MSKKENYVDMVDVCELAHLFTVRECEQRGIEVDMGTDKNGDETERYSEKAQSIFDYYYDKITETLRV